MATRDKIKQHILEEIGKGNHIMLKGPHGIGKSHLAQEIVREKQHLKSEIWMYFPYCKAPRTVLYAILEKFFKLEKRRISWTYYSHSASSMLTVDSIIKLLQKHNAKLILVLDEMHTINSIAAAAYHHLMQQTKRVIIFAISTNPYLERRQMGPEAKRFFWELKHIEMLPAQQEASEFLEKMAKDYKITLDQDTKNKILTASGGNPLAIKKAIEQLSKKEEPKVSDLPVIKQNAVNLFPLFIFSIFVLLAMRYIYRGTGDYELANFSAFFGLILFFLIRYFWWWRRR